MRARNESDYFFMNSRADYGNSYYNRRNAFVLAGNWDLPFGKGKPIGGNLHGWANQIVGGFALNGTCDRGDGFALHAVLQPVLRRSGY